MELGLAGKVLELEQADKFLHESLGICNEFKIFFVENIFFFRF